MQLGGRDSDTDSINQGLYQQNHESKDRLSDEEIHHVLSNQRRRMLLELLLQNGGEMDARDISERLAEAESGTSPAPRKSRQSVYVSLQQTHLPKLDSLGIVDFNEQSKNVKIEEDFDQISEYLTHSSKSTSWSGLYLLLSLIGILSLAAYVVSLPPFAWVPQGWWFGLIFVVILCTSSYQVYIDRIGS